MPSNALTRNAIDATLNTLQEGSATVIAPRDGVSIIDDWLKALQDAAQAKSVSQNLMQLRSLLQMPNPDTFQVKQLLDNLADQTTQLAQSQDSPWTNELESITVALRNFSSQL